MLAAGPAGAAERRHPPTLAQVRRHPAVTYTLLRVLIFLAALGVCYLLGARDWLLVLLAVLVSGLASYVLLARQRDAMSTMVADKVRRVRDRIDASAAAEDDDEPR